MAQGPLDAAIAFLHRVLADGPMGSQDMLELAAREGLSRSTVKRARIRIGALSVRDGSRWTTVLTEQPEPRVRSQGGEPGTVSMSTIMDKAALDELGHVAEFERWHAPQSAGGGRGAWSPERRAAFIGFVSANGSKAMGARFIGVAHSTVDRWLERGEKDAEAAVEGEEPTQHMVFRYSYLRAMGYLGGKLMAVVVNSALGDGTKPPNVAHAQWCLTMQHGVRERIEIDHNPTIELSEQQRRDEFMATMAEMKARRIALAKTEP